MTSTIILVYGTLLRGDYNHHVLGDSTLLGEAATLPEFYLVNCGRYPAMIPGGKESIIGELYAVNATVYKALDELEDYPRLYDRVEIALQGGARAIAYVMYPDTVTTLPVIPGNSWRAYQRAQGFGV